jgi:hypothetical protein
MSQIAPYFLCSAQYGEQGAIWKGSLAFRVRKSTLQDWVAEGGRRCVCVCVCVCVYNPQLQSTLDEWLFVDYNSFWPTPLVPHTCQNTAPTTCLSLFPPHSLYLFKLGLAPQIQDLYGKVDFTGECPNTTVFHFLSLNSFSLSLLIFLF